MQAESLTPVEQDGGVTPVTQILALRDEVAAGLVSPVVPQMPNMFPASPAATELAEDVMEEAVIAVQDEPQPQHIVIHDMNDWIVAPRRRLRVKTDPVRSRIIAL